MDKRLRVKTYGHVGNFIIGMLVAARNREIQSIDAARPLNVILSDEDTQRLGETPTAVWRLDSVEPEVDRHSAWLKYLLGLTMMADGKNAGRPPDDFVNELTGFFGDSAAHVPETNGWVGVERWIRWKRSGAGMMGLGCWVLLVQRDDDCPPCWRDDHPEGGPECLERWTTGWTIMGADTKEEAVINAALGLWGAPATHMTDCDFGNS